MRLMASFFCAYPWQTLTMLCAMLFAGAAEGIGLSALLPLLNIAINNGTTGAVSAGGAATQNQFERAVHDLLSSYGLDPSIGTMLTIIVIGIILKSLLMLVAQKQIGYTAAQIATDLRLDMLRAILRSRWEYFLHQPVGKLTNALATEAHRAAAAFVNGAMVITALIQALIYGSVALAVSWKATLISLLGGVILIGISHFLVRMSRKAGKKQTQLLISLIALMTDTLQSVKPLKAMAREHSADAILSRETSRLNKALQRQVFSSAALNTAQEVMFAVLIAFGMFVALVPFAMPFTTVMVLVIALGRMLVFLGKVQKQYQKMVIDESAFWSLKHAIEDARQAQEELGIGKAPSLAKAIQFQAVGFAYTGRRVFNDVSLTIPRGSLTALTGASGAGKTTIIDLIIGLLQPQAGSILIDGKPLPTLDLKAWRRMIGYVPQETHLLHDTVLHNVTLGDAGLSLADAEGALRAAGAWEFVSALPLGLHNVVGERGGKLSGGQRQRIVIARALVHRPKLLILDEATNALDSASEQAICQTMTQLRGELTILAVSHQSALIDAADRVYHLANGEVKTVEKTGLLCLIDN